MNLPNKAREKYSVLFSRYS